MADWHCDAGVRGPGDSHQECGSQPAIAGEDACLSVLEASSQTEEDHGSIAGLRSTERIGHRRQERSDWSAQYQATTDRVPHGHRSMAESIERLKSEPRPSSN